MMLQPSLYSCKELNEFEAEYLDKFSNNRIAFFKDAYDHLKASIYKNISLLQKRGKLKQLIVLTLVG